MGTQPFFELSMFLEQAIRLVTQAPDNLAYHILTLLAVQAALALSLWQWRQKPQDTFAGRLAGAAALIFLLRVVLAYVLASTTQSDLLAILPPLERALDLTVSALLVWAFVPSAAAAPRLSEVLLFFALVAIGVAYVLAVPDWASQLAQGVRYTQTAQIGAWAIAQLVLLGLGILLVVLSRPHDWALRGLVLLLIGAGHLAHLLRALPISEATLEAAVPYWVRLAYLVALPLVAVLAYRHSLAQVLDAHWGARPLGEQFATLLDLASGMMRQPGTRGVLHGGVNLAARIMGAKFAAVGTFLPPNYSDLSVVSWQEDDTLRGGRTWMIKAGDWPGIQLALRQRATVELMPNGIGARQLFALYQELGLSSQGAMVIEPLFGPQEEQVGVLLLGGPPNTPAWSADDKALTPYLGRLIAYTLAQAQPVPPTVTPSPPPISAPDGEERQALATERDRAIQRTLVLADLLEETRQAVQEREAKIALAQAETADLQAQVAQLRTQPDHAQLVALQEETAALRESLRQAEEAMALASAGEGGLSPEWVMMTITHYSAELEEAQRRIRQLEAQLGQADPDQTRGIIGRLGEELRQPLAAIAGYTELLLSESAGILTPKQRHLLERAQVGMGRMETILNRMAEGKTTLTDLVAQDPINLTETVEAAVAELLPQLREKQLVLDLQIPDTLPLLAVPRDVVYRIAQHLLTNALKVTPAEGRLQFAAETRTWQDEGDPQPNHFVQFLVVDEGGGIPPTLRPFVFNPRLRRNGQGLIPGVSNDAGLLQAYELAQLHGGRIWVESQEGVGSTFYVLLPLWPATKQEEE